MSESNDKALIRTILLSAGLGALKLAVALWSGSQAVFAAALDSISDAVVSGINLFFLRQARLPPDEEHPFGHGKLEGLASLSQGVFLSTVVGLVGYRAVGVLTAEDPPMPEVGAALGMMLVSMATAAFISRSLEQAARKSGSLILKSDAVHYRMDIWTGLATVLGLIATYATGNARADAVAALVLAAWMAKEVIGLLREAIHELMDRSFSAEDHQALQQAMELVRPEIRSFHELRTRRAGPDRFVEVHIVLNRDILLADAHAIGERFERAVQERIPGCKVMVHLDVDEPEGPALH